MHIPFVFLLMMEPTDDMHFRASRVDRLLASSENLLVAHHVAFGIAKVGSKSAKITSINTHVGGIQVGIDVVIGNVFINSFANDVGQSAYVIQRRVWIVEGKPVFNAKSFSVEDFVSYCVEAAVGSNHAISPVCAVLLTANVSGR